MSVCYLAYDRENCESMSDSKEQQLQHLVLTTGLDVKPNLFSTFLPMNDHQVVIVFIVGEKQNH